jgi:tetratricopeptide (TPR) repeat protein
MRALVTSLAVAVAASSSALAAEVAAEPAPSPGAASASSPDAAAASSGAVAQPAAAAVTAPPPARRPAVVPSQAVVDKVGLGDRLLLAGDLRAALFAYQDAVHAQPAYAPARVRLGRAYLALRYPGLAIPQAEAVLAEDPENADARKLLDDAQKAPPRAMPGAGPGSTPAPASGAATPGRPGARVFKLAQDPDAKAAAPAAAPTPPPAVTAVPGAATAAGATPQAATPASSAAPRALAGTAAAGGVSAAPLAVPGGVAVPVPVPAVPAAAAGARSRSDTPGPEPVSAAQKQVAALHYRTALGFLQTRDWTKAVAALSDAILADPTLAVAYSARGSAHFGLGKYREASDDYATAMRLDPKLGTPLYGLAECHRVLGDGKKAAEMYDRYAQSTAPDVRADLKATAARRAKELR